MEPWWSAALTSVFGGHRVVLAGAVAAAWTEHLPVLRAAGATDILVVATEGRGVGPQPDVETVAVDPPADQSLMERIHHGTRLLEDPPPIVIDALTAFDPTRDAVVLGTFLNTARHLDGRPFVAYRHPEWVALEDKTCVDEFWDRAGIERQPSVVVPLEDAERAAASLDLGQGTVWAADARDGFHGGAEHTHWVDGVDAAEQARTALAAHCDRVRVMPFVDGVPASIHGIVLPDGVVALRPVEMVVLRRPRGDAASRFFYSGCATYFDPPAPIRDHMREVARRAGRRLAADVDFRGTFTVDGVVAPDGFWPTELNPRFGAGINTIARAGGDLPLLLLNELIAGGFPIGRSAADLEAELVESADARRAGGTWKAMLPSTPEIADRPIAFDDGRWRWADDGDTVAGHVAAGSGFVRCRFASAATPVGPSTGGRAAAFWDFADRQLGTAIGPLEAPPSPLSR